MYDYHVDIVWSVNMALAVTVMITSAAIFVCVVFKEHLWHARRRALRDIKRNVYEIVLAGKSAPRNTSEPFVTNLTPRQLIDIETNRNIDSAFFNDSEQQFFRSYIARPEMLSKIEKIASASRNKWQKIEALIVLGYTNETSSMEILKRSLVDKDRDVAYFSLISLGQIRTVQSAVILLELLQKIPSNGYKIVSILENFPEEISGEVIKLTEHYDPMVRYWALTLLSKIKFTAYFKQVERLTQDQAPEVRAAACDCLGASGNKDGARALQKCMQDDSWLVKTHAILAFGKVMGDAAVPEVTKFINDASWSVLDAVREVMTNHIETSLPYIARFLDGDDEIAKKYSIIALENSGYLVKLLDDAISGSSKDLTMRLLKGIVRSRVRRGLDTAIRRLKPDARAKAMEVLEKIEKA